MDGKFIFVPARVVDGIITEGHIGDGEVERFIGEFRFFKRLRADVSVKGGSFDTYLSKARRSGWVDGDRQSLKITRAGLEALGHWEPLPKGKDLLNHWIRKMGTGGASRMLLALSNLYPLSCTAQHLGITAGVSVDGGSFDTYLSRLRGFDLITGDRTALRASEEFFT